MTDINETTTKLGGQVIAAISKEETGNGGHQFPFGDPSTENAFEQEATQMTCDALCSLSSVASPNNNCLQIEDFDSVTGEKSKKQRGNAKPCPKHLQLPMFLSSEFILIFVFCEFIITHN